MAALSKSDRRERDLWLADIQARAEQLRHDAEQLVERIQAERASRHDREEKPDHDDDPEH